MPPTHPIPPVPIASAGQAGQGRAGVGGQRDPAGQTSFRMDQSNDSCLSHFLLVPTLPELSGTLTCQLRWGGTGSQGPVDLQLPRLLPQALPGHPCDWSIKAKSRGTCSLPGTHRLSHTPQDLPSSLHFAALSHGLSSSLWIQHSPPFP